MLCCSDEMKDIFGSSDSDNDFEAFIANAKQNRKKSVSSEHSEDEIEERTRKKPKRPVKLKKPKAGNDVPLYRDKENLMRDEEEMEAKPPPPRQRFKRRPAPAELSILEGFLEEGLDKEDVQMFKLALARLKGEGHLLTKDLGWAHYPHNILSLSGWGLIFS